MPRGGEVSLWIEETGEADDRVEPQQFDRGLRRVEINLAGAELGFELLRQGIGIHLQPQRKGRCRCEPRSDPAPGFPLDGIMHPQGIAPESLISKSFETERLPPFLQHGGDICIQLRADDRRIECFGMPIITVTAGIEQRHGRKPQPCEKSPQAQKHPLHEHLRLIDLKSLSFIAGNYSPASTTRKAALV